MDWDLVLIVLLSMAIFIAVINLYDYWVKLRKAEIKKRLSNLYYPLHSILAKKNKYVMPLKNDPDVSFDKFAAAYYEIFLELKNRYLDHKLYESSRLSTAFGLLLDDHSVDLCEENRDPHLPKEVVESLGLFELNYQVDDDGLSQIERNMEKVEEVIERDISRMVKIKSGRKRAQKKGVSKLKKVRKETHESQ